MNSIFPILVSMSVAVPIPKINTAELDKLKGDWVLVKSCFYEEWVDHDSGTTTVKIDDSQITFFNQNARKPSSMKIVKLDSGKIDLLTEIPYKGDTVLGICEIKGEELWLCYNLAGLPSQADDPPTRPTVFKSPKRSCIQIWIFKRAKKEESKEKK